MNNNERILLTVFKTVYGSDFNPNNPGEKMRMHKTVYLLQEMGTICGDYDFFWHVHGPYSHQLHGVLLDIEKEMADGGKCNNGSYPFSDEVKEKLNTFKNIMVIPENVTYKINEWCETLGSLHYLKKYRYSCETDENIIAILEIEKPHLNSHENNNIAMTILNKVAFCN